MHTGGVECRAARHMHREGGGGDHIPKMHRLGRSYIIIPILVMVLIILIILIPILVLIVLIVLVLVLILIILVLIVLVLVLVIGEPLGETRALR
jgi:hypothetical protein